MIRFDLRRYSIYTIALFLFFFSAMSMLPGGKGYCAETQPPIASFKEYNQSVLETIDMERETIERYREQLSAAQDLWSSLKGEINAYRIQLSAHGNLLLTLTTGIEPLEKAAVENQTSVEQVKKRLAEINGQIDTLHQAQSKNEEQHRFNGEQLAEIKTQKQDDRDAKILVKSLEVLVKTLSDKQKAIEMLLAEYSKEKETLDEIGNALAGLSNSFEIRIEEKKKEKLFQRGDTPFKVTQFSRIAAEAVQIRQKTVQMISPEYWRNELKSIWELEGFRLVSFLVLLLLALLFLARMYRLTRKLADRPFFSGFPWRSRTFRIFSRSLPLLGVLLVFSIFKKAWNINELSVFSLLYGLLWIVLSVQWMLDALHLMTDSEKPGRVALNLPHLRLLVFSVGGFAILYGGIDWMIEGVSSTLLALRALFETGLVLWGLHLRRKIRSLKTASASPASVQSGAADLIIHGLGYTVIGAGPLLELFGFGEFALYWYLSWARTIIVFLWAGLLVMVLKEWDHEAHLTEGEIGSGAKPVRWAIFRICWLGWASLLFFSLFFAWGARQQVIDGFIQVLKYPVQIGELQLSLMGLIYAFLALFFTHLTVKTCRYLLKEKLLIKSGLDRGLQESITNITTYLVWGLGILTALHAVGVNTASLAVVLGALGIGLGFGLQNIFNNFVSGIILLFERPIQAGDDVEINGVMATVKKINVRSTVVQTYDNASLIIPNSEFISNPVTNWSFKDRRLRRKIQVGVAYGTDTALVKATLLEIAGSMPKVLKHPGPDVLFTDFADSALIFTLRIWTTIDHMVHLESDIRYEIDRLFKERDISIAFPQQDVHLYHMNRLPGNPIHEKPA